MVVWPAVPGPPSLGNGRSCAEGCRHARKVARVWLWRHRGSSDRQNEGGIVLGSRGRKPKRLGNWDARALGGDAGRTNRSTSARLRECRRRDWPVQTQDEQSGRRHVGPGENYTAETRNVYASLPLEGDCKVCNDMTCVDANCRLQ